MSENLVHLGDRCDRSFGRIRVHLAQRVRSRLQGEEIRGDGVVGLVVILYLNKCHEVAFGWKRERKFISETRRNYDNLHNATQKILIVESVEIRSFRC